MNIVKEIDISAPPERVYEYLLDFPRHSEWTTPGHGVQIKPTSSGPTAVGSTFESNAHMFGAQHDLLNVTELVPNRRIVYEATMKNGDTFRHTFELQPSGSGTHLGKRFQTMSLALISKLKLPLGYLIAARLTAGDVQRIKANLEPGSRS